MANNADKILSKVIKKVGMKLANRDVNQACVMYFYQPKVPKSLKKKK